MSLEELNKKHKSYNESVHRYNFLYRSYIGGDHYRKGGYLHKYWGEDQAPFDAYARRLEATPLSNHVRTTVDIYRSYIWKKAPSRDFNNLAGNPFVERFMNNADLQGQSFDSWLKNALDWSLVLGGVWILVDKPNTSAQTAAEEIANDLRAYVTMYTPQNVLDWKWSSNHLTNELEFVKTIEARNRDTAVVRCWYPEVVITYTVQINERTGEFDQVLAEETMTNELGKIPMFPLVPQPLPGERGIGASMLGDVADIQRSIYNKLSELEQTIRLSVHPTLVKTHSATANAGAGAIINIDEETDAGLKPYLLQPSGASIDGILKSIEADIDAINSMTHLTAVRAQKGSAQSGIALQTERQLLNAKLTDLSDTIREAEYKIWDLWCEWMEVENNITVEYCHHYDTRDPKMYIDTLTQSIALVNDPAYTQWAREEIIRLTVSDPDEQEALIGALSQDINNTTIESTPDSE